jgi:hypothetical protein
MMTKLQLLVPYYYIICLS